MKQQKVELNRWYKKVINETVMIIRNRDALGSGEIER